MEGIKGGGRLEVVSSRASEGQALRKGAGGSGTASLPAVGASVALEQWLRG